MTDPASAPIYLDNAASTPTDPDLAERLARDMVALYANPSSAHAAGRTARRTLDEARAALEALTPGYAAAFTQGGSAALALGLRGAWLRAGRRGQRILVSAVEHPAVHATAAGLAREHHADVEEVPVLADGRLDLAAFEAALRRGAPPAIVAIMAVQNEVGAVMPLREAGRLLRVHAPDAFLLVDAVQALGKIPLEPAAWGADAAAISSHKVHGPKGAGALLLARRFIDGAAEDHLAPLIAGGGQERGLVAGTESVALAGAFVEACRRACSGLDAARAHVGALRQRLLDGLRGQGLDLVVNGPDDPARVSPAILSVSLRGIAGAALLERLDREGIYVAAGAACHAGGTGLTRTQRALGWEAWRGAGAVRFGLSKRTTQGEIDRAVARVAHHVRALREPTAPRPRGSTLGSARAEHAPAAAAREPGAGP